MRYLAVPVMLSGSISLGQTGTGHQACANPPTTVTQFYVDEVLRHLQPPQASQVQVLIKISLIVTGRPKLVLWTDGDTFALDRGTTGSPIYRLLDELENSCQLPSRPSEAADLVKVKWEHATVGFDAFERLHREFVSALTQDTTDIQDRYRGRLLDRSTTVSLHTPEYSVEYDNRNQRLDFIAYDTTTHDEKMNLVLAWAHSLEKFADNIFSNKRTAPGP
jgi:hypothetical protein